MKIIKLLILISIILYCLYQLFLNNDNIKIKNISSNNLKEIPFIFKSINNKPKRFEELPFIFKSINNKANRFEELPLPKVKKVFPSLKDI